MSTFFIHITGQVQGIGFRPFVYRLAMRLRLKGWVNNQPNGVHIKVKGKEDLVQDFFERLSAEAPSLSCIQDKFIEMIEDEDLFDFKIVKGHDRTDHSIVLTPDLAICADCRHDIYDINNRRYLYAFTTCAQCGPRYSILNQLPYDRRHTAMATFNTCEKCSSEYNNPSDKRFYAQTNSCPDCAIKLQLYDHNKNLISVDQHQIIIITANQLLAGKIVAVKGVGGYLLLADATNEKTLSVLRERKHRPAKPFALMYPDLNMVLQDVYINDEEQRILQSTGAPIVLATKKDVPASGLKSALIAPHMNRLGIMLPYAPLFELILSLFHKPVVATSGNYCGSHIIFRNEEALEHLAGIADFIMVHDRGIVMPQDDSVLQVSPLHHNRIMLRRARGFAPVFSGAMLPEAGNRKLLALGADMKSTFAFTIGNNTYVSQYLGDLSSYDNFLNYKQTLENLTKMLDFKPSQIVIDKHPVYTSTQFGKALAKKHDISYVEVQHHEAHFASVLAENNLLNYHDPVLGIIWDGNGYGNDKIIRGGEFLKYQQNKIISLAQIEPYPHILADKMALEPRISALSICHELTGAEHLLKQYFSDPEWKLYHLILHNKRLLQTTSMGRIFDAVAALLGLCERNSYEGEAAMKLESLASNCTGIVKILGYKIEGFNGKNIPVKTIFSQLITDIERKNSPELIAARFHITLVGIIEKVASYFSLKKIAFSGGVFQNSLLADLIIEKLSPEFQLYFHLQLPPNDECISFGQLSYMHINDLRKD